MRSEARLNKEHNNEKNAAEAANKRLARLGRMKLERCRENPYDYEGSVEVVE